MPEFEPAPAELTQHIAGEVILPTDETYDDHRNAVMYEGKPAVIVRARSQEDVARAIDFARTRELVIAVRSGGHGGAGFSTTDGGLVLDVTLINEVDLIDAGRRIVRIGSGATWEIVANALAPYGLAISAGDTTKVGVGGLVLGGGMGWMVRKYGLTIDSLVGAEVVTADGQVLRASADEHPDLFWALRGGGGNFGVVTYVDVVAQPVREVYAGSISYPLSDAANVVKRLRDVVRTAPEELTTIVTMLPEGLRPQPFTIGVCVASGDREAAEKIVAPLRELGEVTAQDLTVKPYADTLADPPPAQPGVSPVARNSLTPDLSDELIDLVVAGHAAGDTTLVQFRSLGGAVSRVPSDATAFAYRDSEALIWTAMASPAPEARKAFRRFRASLAAHTSGAHGNLMNTVEYGDVAAIYPPRTYTRLAEVKRAYDPENVFRKNYNIRPD